MNREKCESQTMEMYALLKVENRKEVVVEGSCLQSAAASVARTTQLLRYGLLLYGQTLLGRRSGYGSGGWSRDET